MKWFSLIATDLSFFTFVESDLGTHSFNTVVRAKIIIGTQECINLGSGEMTWFLRACAVLPEDQVHFQALTFSGLHLYLELQGGYPVPLPFLGTCT